jgi:hypothetical protein
MVQTWQNFLSKCMARKGLFTSVDDDDDDDKKRGNNTSCVAPCDNKQCCGV